MFLKQASASRGAEPHLGFPCGNWNLSYTSIELYQHRTIEVAIWDWIVFGSAGLERFLISRPGGGCSGYSISRHPLRGDARPPAADNGKRGAAYATPLGNFSEGGM